MPRPEVVWMSFLLLRHTVLVFAFAPSMTVSVTVNSSSDHAQQDVLAMRASVLTRLHERGHTVSSSSADVAVDISSTPNTVVITAQTASLSETMVVERDGMPPIVFLEVVQRALLAVDAVSGSMGSPSPTKMAEGRAYVGVTLGNGVQLDDVLPQLVDASLVVVPPNERATRELCISHRDATVVAIERGAAEQCPSDADFPSNAAPLKHIIAKLSSSVKLPLPSSIKKSKINISPQPRPSPTRPQHTLPSAPPPSSWSWGIGHHGGASFRHAMTTAQGIDPFGGFDGWATHVRGLGLSGTFELIPSRGERLQITETVLTVGPRWTLFPRQTLWATFSLEGGPWIHTYRLDNERLQTHVDAHGVISAGLIVHVRPSFYLQMSLFGGLSHRRRRHLSDGDVLWQRGAARVGLRLGMGFGVRNR